MKDSTKNKLKKQIVSGGIYIALAAAVVTVTMNGVKNIIGSTQDYDIPDTNIELPEINIEEINVPNQNLPDEQIKNPQINLELPSVHDNHNEIDDIIDRDINADASESNAVKPSGNSANGVSDNIIETDEKNPDADLNNNIDVSGEPDDIEYPTEPDPVSYDVYAKPADGYIDKEYSDEELLYSVTMGDYRTHNGIDITGDPGSKVRAVNAGVILDIYYDEFYGHTIEIDHGNGIVAFYMNLSESLPNGVTKGAKVAHGQIIGGIGNSAAIESAEVSHLHLSIKRNGEFVDPREVLRANY